jgi:hypothetical protein
LLNNDGDGSTLTFDFTTGVLDPRLTFTRGSVATFINSSGLVQWAAANMMTRSQSQDVNGYWSAFSTAVTRTASQTDPFGGSGAVKLDYDATSADAVISRSMSVQQGLQYTISVWLRADSGTLNNVRFGRAAAATGAYFPSLTTTWQRFSFTFTATGSTDGIELRVLTSGTPKTASFHVFGAQLEPGDTMRDYNPALLDVPYHAPRFDYDPTTRAPRGLLVEGATANNCLNGSMAYTATAPTSWARGFSGCTVASVDSTTFLGQKAWSISATAIEQRDFLEQVIALAANTTYTVSVYLEAVTGTVATFAYMTSLPSGATSNSVANPSAGRISFTVTVAGTAGNGTLRIGIGASVGTGVSADASVRFSHVQVEAGTGASSYFPTGASTATRNEDSATMPITAAQLGFDLYRYTMRVRGRQNKFAAASSFARNLRLHDASTEQIGLPVSNNTLYGTSRNTSNNAIAEVSSAATLNQDFRFAWALDADLATNTMLGSLNQSPLSASRSATGPMGSPTTLAFNTNTSPTSNFASMTIRDVKFWPRQMTASELNALTAP